MAAPKLSKNAMRRAKKKEQKKSQSEPTPTPEPQQAANVQPEIKEEPAAVTTVKIEDDAKDPEVAALDISEDDPNYEMYRRIMERFGATTEEEDPASAVGGDRGEIFYSDDDEMQDEEAEAETVAKLSKKKRKEQSKLSVAELKALVKKPETVEWTDTSAQDPRLLVHIKSYRNVVPVPSHWSLKREYLSSKRGVEKAPFSLPKFIQETGIAEMRDAVLEKQDAASLKQKQRERVQPKMGKLDIDYQKLYEAFFRFQTKPELTRFGEVYYEGKEYETNLKHLRPGELSDELKEALNIPPGAPPPWLINMQRFGPPPSYPTLKIPGLNAPPPPGGAWGFHPGGYGKPPVDEFNRPLYGGDIFGVLQPSVNNQAGAPVERTLWGELQSPEEEEEESEEEEEDEDEDANGEEEDIGAGLQTPSGLETPGGLASTVPSEYGAPDTDFELRKRRAGMDSEDPSHPRSAYTVLPERQIRAEGFFGGQHAYDIRASSAPSSGSGSSAAPPAHIPVLGRDDPDSRKRKKPGDVDVALDPDALVGEDGISQEELQRRYEAGRREDRAGQIGGQWGGGGGGFEEDLSEMIARESGKRLKRDEERRDGRREEKGRSR